MKRSITLAMTTGVFTGACFSSAVAQTPQGSPAAVAVPVASAGPELLPSAAPPLLGTVATDPAQTIVARVGQTFAIALRSNRTTGFSWQLAQPPSAAVQTVGSAYEAPASLPGAGGQEIWLFRAASAGVASIVLRYVRPFEKGSAQMERALTFRVEIGP